MNDFKDLLFIIENYRGRSEHNMLFTKEEFTAFLCNKGLSDCVEDVAFLLDHESSYNKWRSMNLPGISLEFRRCNGEQDLCNYLEGKYNDSVAKMSERGLHPFDPFCCFKWDISVASFSPLSLSSIISLKEKYPSLNERCQALFSEKSSLDDIIKNCVQSQSTFLNCSDSHTRFSAREH